MENTYLFKRGAGGTTPSDIFTPGLNFLNDPIYTAQPIFVPSALPLAIMEPNLQVQKLSKIMWFLATI